MRIALSACVHRGLATWALLLGRPDSALRHWRTLRELRPHDARVPAALAHLLAADGRHEAALEQFHEALALDAKVPAVWFNQAFVQQQAGLHKQALDSFERALALDPAFDRALYGQALSLIALGRVSDAIAPLKRNTELQPMSPFGWYHLAHAYWRLGEAGQARQAIRTLASFEPQVARQIEREIGQTPVRGA